MSPEAYIAQFASWSDLHELAQRYYAAVRDRDLEGVLALVDERFQPDAVVLEPDALAWGGTYEGLPAVKELLAAKLATGSPFESSRLAVEHVIEAPERADELDHLVAAIDLGWTRVLEWWTFRDLRVAEIRSFYWDPPTLTSSPR